MLKIYKKYHKLNKNINNYTGISNLKLLKKSDLKYPDFQRILNQDNVLEIQEQHKNNTLNTILFEIGFLDGDYYLIDGQHRYMALLNINNLDYEFTIHLHKMNSFDELKELFFLINKHTKIPEEWISINNHNELKSNLSNIFKLKIFDETLKSSKKPYKPNISRSELENIITDCYKADIKLNANHFITLNNYYKTLSSENFPSSSGKKNEEYLNICSDKKCYIGMVIDKRCDYEILINDLKALYNNKKINLKIYDNIKTHIPQSIREHCWKNYKKDSGQQNLDEIKCPLSYCNNMIDSFNFDTGHIISDKNGGDIKLSNLKPICSSCNKSMGSKNWDDFEKLYNS